MGKKANYPIGREPRLRVPGTTQTHSPRDQDAGERELQKNVDRDREDATGVGKLHPLPPKNTFPVVKGKTWGVGALLWARKRNKKRHLYEFSCYFSEVIIGQFLFPKLARNSYLKGGAGTVQASTRF